MTRKFGRHTKHMLGCIHDITIVVVVDFVLDILQKVENETRHVVLVVTVRLAGW